MKFKTNKNSPSFVIWTIIENLLFRIHPYDLRWSISRQSDDFRTIGKHVFKCDFLIQKWNGSKSIGMQNKHMIFWQRNIQNGFVDTFDQVVWNIPILTNHFIPVRLVGFNGSGADSARRKPCIFFWQIVIVSTDRVDTKVVWRIVLEATWCVTSWQIWIFL